MDKELKTGIVSVHRKAGDDKAIPETMSPKFCANRFRTDTKAVVAWIASKKYRDRQKAGQDRAHLFAGSGRHAASTRPFDTAPEAEAESGSDPENLSCDGDDCLEQPRRMQAVDTDDELDFKPRKMKRKPPTAARKIVRSEKRKRRKQLRRQEEKGE